MYAVLLFIVSENFVNALFLQNYLWVFLWCVLCDLLPELCILTTARNIYHRLPGSSCWLQLLALVSTFLWGIGSISAATATFGRHSGFGMIPTQKELHKQ
jgi:hypothetical protein